MSVDESGALHEVIQDFEYLDEKSSIHGLAMSPDSDVLYSADTYGNNIWTHAVSKTTGLVGEVLDKTIGPSPGSNPRHVSAPARQSTVCRHGGLQQGRLVQNRQRDSYSAGAHLPSTPRWLKQLHVLG
jgi:hypothetical protein